MKTIGITIGPIFETLLHTKKTRELWFASYLFSWYMELFATKIKEAGYKLIIPYDAVENKKTYGIYHDRIIFSSKSIFQTKNKINKKLTHINEEIIDFFSSSLKNSDLESDKDKEWIKKVLKDYIQMKWIILNENFDFNKINDLLNQLEQTRTFNMENIENPCDRCRFLPSYSYIEDPYDKNTKGVTKFYQLCPICSLKNIGFKLNELKNKIDIEDFFFPSVFNIAVADILDKLEQNEIDALRKGNPEIENQILAKCKEKNYLKYFALVYIDGDNVGKFFSKLSEISEVKKLSKTLHDYSDTIDSVVSKYKGLTIYASGDDLLAILPIYCQDQQTKEHLSILHFIDSIRDEFTKNVNKINETVKETDIKLTISMGISINYFKYPLKQAIQNAIDMLSISKIKGKNQANMMIIKHSGHKEFLKIQKLIVDDENKCLLRKYISLIESILNEHYLPHSLFIKLNIQRDLLFLLKDKPERINYFIKNNFNESEHEKFSDGFKVIINILENIIQLDDVPRKAEFKNLVNILHFSNLLLEEK